MTIPDIISAVTNGKSTLAAVVLLLAAHGATWWTDDKSTRLAGVEAKVITVLEHTARQEERLNALLREVGHIRVFLTTPPEVPARPRPKGKKQS